MKRDFFYERINILKEAESNIKKDAILIINGNIFAFGEEARKEAKKRNLKSNESGNKLIAPLLTDMHSYLDDPICGLEDNLINLKERAKKSGYGSIVLLPNSKNWRDVPEKIPFQKNHNDDIQIFFWGSFTLQNLGIQLSPHDDLFNKGIVGLSSLCFDDLRIIYQGIKLDFIKSNPILFENNKLKNKVFLETDIKAIQSGFHSDDMLGFDNILKVLNLKKNFPDKNLIIQNVSDIRFLKELRNKHFDIKKTVSWWNLVADTSNLEINDLGWKSYPHLVSKEIRENLIYSLEKDLIDAIAVNSKSIKEEETFKAINDREAGISSYELVLPLLWDELISKRSWYPSKLWNHLSFKPSRLLNLPEEKLNIGSKRWLIFDPELQWVNTQANLGYDSPTNFPKKNKLIKGKVISNGLLF